MKVKSIISAVLAAALLFLATGCSSTESELSKYGLLLEGASWPMGGGANNKTLYVAGSSSLADGPVELASLRIGGTLADNTILDIDGDGVPEYIAVSGGSVYAAKTDTKKQLWKSGAISASGLLTAADLDGDGKTELLVACAPVKRITVLSGADGKELSHLEFSGPLAVEVGTNGTWRVKKQLAGVPGLQLVTCIPKTGQVAVYSFEDIKNPKTQWVYEELETLPYFVAPLVLADMNRDGTDDAIVATCGATRVINGKNGAVMMELKHDHDRCYGVIAAADADGDGWTDIFATGNSVSYHILVMKNQAGKSLTRLWGSYIMHSPDSGKDIEPQGDSFISLGGGKTGVALSLYNSVKDGKIVADEILQAGSSYIHHDAGDNLWHLTLLEGTTGRILADIPGYKYKGSLDLDGDNRPEIFGAPANGGALAIFKYNPAAGKLEKVGELGEAALMQGGAKRLPQSVSGFSASGMLTGEYGGRAAFAVSTSAGVKILARDGVSPTVLLDKAGALFEYNGKLISLDGLPEVETGGVHTEAAIADIDGDGAAELAYIDNSSKLTVARFSNTQGKTEIKSLWQAAAPDGSAFYGEGRSLYTKRTTMNTPTLYDYNGDKKLEIAVHTAVLGASGDYTGAVYIYGADGGLIKEIKVPGYIGEYRFCARPGGKTGLLVSWFTQKLIVSSLTMGMYDAESWNFIWKDPKVMSGGNGNTEPVLTAPYPGYVLLYDLNSDGAEDLIYQDQHCAFRFVDGQTGKELYPACEYYADSQLFGYATPVLVDPDTADGEDGLFSKYIMSSGGWTRQVCLRFEGGVYQKYWTGPDYAAGDVYGALSAFGDINGDGKTEVFVSYRDPDCGINVLNAAGNPKRSRVLWDYKLGAQPYAMLLTDTDADGLPELIYGGEDGKLTALSAADFKKGSGSLWSYDIGSPIKNIAAADINGDGLNELIISSDDGYMHFLGPDLSPAALKALTDKAAPSAKGLLTRAGELAEKPDKARILAYIKELAGSGAPDAAQRYLGSRAAAMIRLLKN